MTWTADRKNAHIARQRERYADGGIPALSDRVWTQEQRDAARDRLARPVRIGDVTYPSGKAAAAAESVSPATITRWIRIGRAHRV